jgi:hypothetical protein
MIGSNVGEEKWSSSKLHLNWVVKESYLVDPSHINGRNFWRFGGVFSFVFMLQIVKKKVESPSVNCYNLSYTEVPLIPFSIECQ